MSPDWELQVALKAMLAAYAPLVAVLAEGADSIRDHAQQGTPYPYLVIGEASSLNDDTKSTNGWSFAVTIHCWSDYSGRKIVKEINAHIYDALHHQDIAINGFQCVDCRYESSETFLEPNGRTRQGVITFDIDVEPA